MAHILVVDDNEVVRKVVAHILEIAGHRVSEAPNGSEALEVLSQVSPDMVLTDLDMPVMDGATFLRKARQRFPGIPCAGMSGDSTAAGFDGFIRKPFDIKDLIEMIRRILTGGPVPCAGGAYGL